jgi:hypothetical protein
MSPFGAMAMLPTAKDGWSSVSGIQFDPPLVLFHTPPWAPPMYIVAGLLGSIAIAVTRPLQISLVVFDVHTQLLMGAGPIEIHLPSPN